MREFYFLLLVALFGAQAQAQLCTITAANASQDFCTICSAGPNPAIVDGQFSGQLHIETDYTISTSCLQSVLFGPQFSVYFDLQNGGLTYRLTFEQDPYLAEGATVNLYANKSKRGIIVMYNEIWDNKEGVYGLGTTGRRFENLERVMQQNATYFTLPVSLVEWTAKQAGSEVDLRWTTNDEAEHDYFVVEHSSDGATFEPLVAVMNPEQSYEGLYRDYHFVHRNPQSGTNYYRLVQYDTDGSVTTFDTRSVHTKQNVTSSVTPNPAHAGQEVGLNGNEEIHEASLYRLDGTLVASYREDQTALSAVTLPTNLSTGTYVLRAGQQTHRIFVR